MMKSSRANMIQGIMDNSVNVMEIVESSPIVWSFLLKVVSVRDIMSMIMAMPAMGSIWSVMKLMAMSAPMRRFFLWEGVVYHDRYRNIVSQLKKVNHMCVDASPWGEMKRKIQVVMAGMSPFRLANEHVSSAVVIQSRYVSVRAASGSGPVILRNAPRIRGWRGV